MQSTENISQPREPDPPSLTELFHRVNSVIPDDQSLLTVEPEMPLQTPLICSISIGFHRFPSS